MPTLLEVQQGISRSLLGAVGGGGDEAVPGLGAGASERLSIHRETCRSTLLHALRLAFPAVRRLVGEEFFAGAAHRFIDDAEGGIPESAWLNEYGQGFAPFLASFPPAAALPYLADVARLEWAVNGALHAPDAARLDAAELASRTAGDAEVRFVPHPSVELLGLEYPADTIWRAVLEENDAALAAVDLASGPVWLLIERAETGIEVGRLTEHAWRFTERLCAGLPFCVALDAFVAGSAGVTSRGTEPHERAAVLLAQHFSAGRFIDALRPGIPSDAGGAQQARTLSLPGARATPP